MGLKKWLAAKFTKRAGEGDAPPIDEKSVQKSTPRAQRLWGRFTKRASGDDIPRIDGKLDKMKRGPILEIWDKVQAMWRMICDPKAAWGEKAIAIGALVYLISPLDVVPDFIPVAGLADDAAIITTAAYKLSKVLKIYMAVAASTVSAAITLKDAAVDAAERRAEIEVRKRLRFAVISLSCGIIAAGIIITLKLALGINSLFAVIAFRGTLICFTVYQGILLSSVLVRFKKVYDRCPKWIAKPLLKWGGQLLKKGLGKNQRLVAFSVAMFVWLILMNILTWLL